MKQMHPAFRKFFYATSVLGAYLALVNLASWKADPSPENKHNIIGTPFSTFVCPVEMKIFRYSRLVQRA